MRLAFHYARRCIFGKKDVTLPATWNIKDVKNIYFRIFQKNSYLCAKKYKNNELFYNAKKLQVCSE
jgi:hypothetical protein